MTTRSVTRVVTAHQQLEGAGFLVRRPLPTRGLELCDPFLLVDEMGPFDLAPGKATGAPDHPHRGFETVSYILEGEVEHEDSAGNRGFIGAGDVQWMTAGRGIVHSEMPSRRIVAEGGRVHGFQIWVNLPARDKMMAPRYQEVPAAKIPSAVSSDGKAQVRVIAGSALGVQAVIDTRTPILYQDWTLSAGASVEQAVPADFQGFAYVFAGSAEVGGKTLGSGQLGLLGPGDSVHLSSTTKARLLLLAGQPINEPVARYGPFVMNTEAELHQAVRDFQSGKLGEIRR